MKKRILSFLSLLLAGSIILNPELAFHVRADQDEASVSGGNTEGENPQEAFTDDEASRIENAREELKTLLEERVVMALVYLSDQYPIRAQASYEADTVLSVPSGQQVQIQDCFVDENYEVWEYVSVYSQDTQYFGYIPRSYLACSDEVFLEWEERYGMNPASQVMALDAEGRQAYPDIQQFPSSYQQALQELKQKHPKWTFVKFNTNLDWNDVVYHELQGGKSLVPNSFDEVMKDGYYGQSWAYASKGALELYLDPRNSLTEDTIFQFEQLTYNASYHTREAVEKLLDGTFMANSKGNAPGTVLTYSEIFWANGREMGISPFHAASRVYQEQGQGKSPLISGNYEGFQGYYNYFNVGASGKTDTEVIVNGLTYAKDKKWTDAYASIRGGMKIIAQNYILKGQDTVYLQKFNVNAATGNLYGHQYMQNICAPTSEAKKIRRAYQDAGALENTFVFKIPVYNNMPAAPCPSPTVSYSVALTAPDYFQDKTVYLDGVAYQANQQDGKYVVNAPNGSVKTAVMYRYDGAGVPVGMYVWRLSHNGKVYTASAVPELENLMSYHGFSIRITGKAGIRFKTGVDAALRSQLTGSNVAGYTLKEYGTLVMTDTNRAKLPMVKGGEKVAEGRSYGYNGEGQLEDKIYETVSGRHRYTSVLVGLPADQYKTDFAFRGYMILSKDGQEITLYGPIVARSIYSLAQQVLERGQYEQGSSADQFLRQLISDADKLN